MSFNNMLYNNYNNKQFKQFMKLTALFIFKVSFRSCVI